jgi:hypothetical protein
MWAQRERPTPAQSDVAHGAAVPQRARLTRERWIVCQYFRCGAVSSENHQQPPDAGVDEQGGGAAAESPYRGVVVWKYP